MNDVLLLAAAWLVIGMYVAVGVFCIYRANPVDPFDEPCGCQSCGATFNSQQGYLLHECAREARGEVCTPGPVWTWCDWSSEEGLLPCICTCTCEDQAHCKRLAPAPSGGGAVVAAGPVPSPPDRGAAGSLLRPPGGSTSP